MKKQVRAVLFTIFIDMLGIGILIPVIPQLFANPASQYYLLAPGASIRYGYFLLGLLTAAYPIAVFFAAPVLGQLSDRYGRKPILAFSLFGTAISYVLFAIGIVIGNIPLLFFARVFDGLTAGNIAVAQAAIADATAPEDRTKNFGLIGMAFGLGFILGPFIGGKLANQNIVSWFNAATPFFAAAGFALINTYLIAYHFTETNHDKRLVKINIWESFQKIKSAKKFGSVRTLFYVNFLFAAGFTFFTSFFNVFLVSKFHYTEAQVGNFFGYIGLCVAIVQGFLTGFIAKKYKDISILTWSYFGTALVMTFFVLPQNVKILFLVVPLFAFAQGLSQANQNGLLSRRAPEGTQGEIMGINTGFVSLAQAIPPLIAGGVAAAFSPSIPILIGSVLIALAGVVFVVKRKDHI